MLALAIGAQTLTRFNVAWRSVPLPGNSPQLQFLHKWALGVFYPDRRPAQRIGIIPDIEVKPTIEGIRAGRDQLIDDLRQINAGGG